MRLGHEAHRPGHEAHRPGYHFSPARNWMNDPNGLVYRDGTYHLFFQHNPSGDQWGDMSWGHATSSDLLAWCEQPLAIPQTFDDRGRPIEDVFSGSVVVDHDNTSGFGTVGNAPLVAVYTSAYTVDHPRWPLKQAQSLAYSTDGGHTWVKYDHNPVLDRDSTDFRDPKVFRYRGDPGGTPYWVMVAVEAVDRQVVIHRSDDLRTWRHLSTFGPANAVKGVWECPDLFELPVDGDPGDTRWVLVVNLNPGSISGGSGCQYFVGDFDGATFTSHSTVAVGSSGRGPGDSGDDDGTATEDHLWLDWGRDHYAAVSFDNAPDAKRIMIGWMNDWTYAAAIPTSGWRSNMTLPREVELTEVGGRIELTQKPVDQMGHYRLGDQALCRSDVPVPAGTHPLEVRGDLLLVELSIEIGDAESAGVVVRASEGFTAEGFTTDGTTSAVGAQGTLVGYDAIARRVFVDRSRSGVVDLHPEFATVSSAPVGPGDTGTVDLSVYVDRASVELFAAGGTRTITDLIFPDRGSQALALFARGGTATVRRLTVTPLGPSMEWSAPEDP